MWRGGLGEEVYVASDAELEEEVEGETVHVCHGEDGEGWVAGAEVEHFVSELHVGPHGSVGEHDALAVSGGAAGVAEQCEVVGSLAEVMDVAGLQVLEGLHVDGEGKAVAGLALRIVIACRIGSGLVFHREVGEVEDSGVESVGILLSADHEHGLGVVVDVLYLLDVELGEDGHDDGAVGECGMEGDGPVGVVLVAQGNLVARLDAQLLEEPVEPRDHLRHVAIGECLARSVVGVGGQSPVLSYGLLHQTDDGTIVGVYDSCSCFCQNAACFLDDTSFLRSSGVFNPFPVGASVHFP